MHPFSKRPTQSISALGETKLIEAIRGWLGEVNPPTPRGIGDDCAVFSASKALQVITVDPIVYLRHFDDAVAPEDAGEKVLKRNLSDIAAMGATATVGVVSLALDPRVSLKWLERFYRGLTRTARGYRVAIVGGDLAEAPGTIVASLTLLGEARSKRVLTRRGAKIGDHIFVTGDLGGSSAGHHVKFIPRLREGAWLAMQPDVRSMMDLSDGLAKDLPALLPARSRAAIQTDRVPISDAARKLAAREKQQPWIRAFCDGEDYELVFTVDQKTDPQKFSQRWHHRFDTPVSHLGQIVRERTPACKGEIDFHTLKGYEHF